MAKRSKINGRCWNEECDCGRVYRINTIHNIAVGKGSDFGKIVDGAWTCSCGRVHRVEG